MRSFAARRGFPYIGPPAPSQWWWNPSRLEIYPPLTRSALVGFQARQVWNVIEGNVQGVTVFIFDSIWGTKGGQPITLIACKTPKNSFVAATSADRVVQSQGWTVLQGVSFLGLTWTLNLPTADSHLWQTFAFPGTAGRWRVIWLTPSFPIAHNRLATTNYRAERPPTHAATGGVSLMRALSSPVSIPYGCLKSSQNSPFLI